jgi:hypothetical protein
VADSEAHDPPGPERRLATEVPGTLTR